MKKVGFIGGADKTNIIVYVAKILEDLEYKVLVVDSTLMQKTRYIVPSINPARSYITDFENVDYAIGFDDLAEIYKYLSIDKQQELPYDYVLIDIDRAVAIERFEIEDTKENFFVTTFDIYSIQRGVEILKKLPMTMNLSKILLNYDMRKEEEQYLLYLTADAKVIWNEFSIYMPIIDENEQLIQENQRVYRTRLKRLIPEYQEGIIYIVQNIVKDMSTGKIRKMVKE